MINMQKDLLLVSDVMTFSIEDIKAVLSEQELKDLIELVKLEQEIIDDDEDFNSIEDDLVYYYYLIQKRLIYYELTD